MGSHISRKEPRCQVVEQRTNKNFPFFLKPLKLFVLFGYGASSPKLCNLMKLHNSPLVGGHLKVRTARSAADGSRNRRRPRKKCTSVKKWFHNKLVDWDVRVCVGIHE